MNHDAGHWRCLAFRYRSWDWDSWDWTQHLAGGNETPLDLTHNEPNNELNSARAGFVLDAAFSLPHIST